MDRQLDQNQPVRPDPTDLRDHQYRPALLRLAPELLPPVIVNDGIVRDQGTTGHCTGYAMAHLIDLHRRLGMAPSAQIDAALPSGNGASPIGPDPVSASMLYYTGRRQELPANASGQALEDGVHSLRSVIKGFYHYGVCRQVSWRPDCNDHQLTPDRAKEAKGITLGAYYRVRPYLNDYHAALTEAQAILVSAEIHDGWRQDAVSAGTPGLITPDETARGGHAFVLVGYNEQGFLVLNSWGREWGGWNGSPGVALWSYEDWADRVMDAWVLRLGVPATEAFAHSNRPMGISYDVGTIQGHSSACHQLLGHYAHLDDGRHVVQGSYASSRTSVEMTTTRISAKPPERREIVLSVSGALLDLKRAFAFEVARKPKLRAMGYYPYAVLWCNDVMAMANAAMSRLMDEAIDRVGLTSPHLNSEIEETCAGIGRAFWRDVGYAAGVAAGHGEGPEDDGDAAHLFDSFAAIEESRIHLLVDGAGAILLADYLRSLKGQEPRFKAAKGRFFERVASLCVIAPTIGFDRFASDLGPLIKSLIERGPERFTLVLPSAALEDRLAVGPYEKSILDLILRSFEGRCSPEDRMVGMARERWPETPDGRTVDDLVGDRVLEVPIPEDGEARRRLDQSVITYNPAIRRQIIANIHQLTDEAKVP